MALSLLYLLLVGCCFGAAGSAVYSPSHYEKAFSRGINLPLTRVRRSRPQVYDGVLTSDISITNSREYAYLVQMSIGGQNFSLILDSGSSDLWVVSSECTGSDCEGVSKYSKSSSTSLSMTGESFKLTYLQGSVLGNVAFENVSLGPYNISPQAFALVNETEGLGLSNTGNSGILGLSFPLPASVPASSGRTLLESVFASLDDYQRFFAYKLGRDQNQNSDPATSSFTIGQLDPMIANDTSGFQYIPVVGFGSTYDYWKLPLRDLTVNSNPLRLSPSLVPGFRTPVAVLDSGTTLILGPSVDVDNFWATIGGNETVRKNSDLGMWEVQCNRAVTVGFTVGGENNSKEYIVHPGDINWGEARSSGGWCMGGIQANDAVNSADWLLGDVFLRNVYVAHHGSTSTQPPLIGLLNTTDATIAMAEFVKERGVDPAQPPPVQNLGARSHPMIKITIISSLSSFVGWVIGVVATTIFRPRKARKDRGIKL